MALVPISNVSESSNSSILQRISHYCQIAADQDQQNLLNGNLGGASTSNEDIADNDTDQQQKPQDLWIKSSMERIEHYMETKKYSIYISNPVQLGEYSNNMIVEQMMMSTTVKDIAFSLKQECKSNK